MTLLWIPVMRRSWTDTRSGSDTRSRLPCRPALAVLGGLLVTGLPACASKDSILPRNLPSMQSIYEGHFEAMGADDLSGARRRLTREGTRQHREVRAGAADLEGFLRSAADEIDNRFPQVANPTLVMFVFPHLGPHGAPVPGYSTAFPLYESVEYALPGEVSP